MFKRIAQGWELLGKADRIVGRLSILKFVLLTLAAGFFALSIWDTLAIAGAIICLALAAFAFLSGRASAAPPPITESASSPKRPERPSLEEVGALAAQCARTATEIYAFLNKHATTDERKVVTEYRQKFDTKVMAVCLDLVEAGLTTTEEYRNVLKPAGSLDDIQWIARILAVSGETYSASRLARNQALAMGELTEERIPHKLSCTARRHVVTSTTERPDGTELETLRCQECGAASHRLLMPDELVPFLDEYRESSGGAPPLPELERWMDQKRIPESQRPRLRGRTEVWFKVLDEEGPFPSSAEGLTS